MSSFNEFSALFTPLRFGRLTLSHRIVLAPLTHSRATKDHIHTKSGVEYYTQRPSVPGSLLITEAAVIHPAAGEYRYAPYIYTDAQVQAWKKVADAVHANNSYIFLQLWAFGCAIDPELLKTEVSSFESVGPSAISMSSSHPTPRPLTLEEIRTYVQWYADAADKAVNKAGFDGVELHFANGYLPDQFLQVVSNQRTDEYGGSIENRARFPLEIIEAVTKVVGEDRVGFRVSPWNPWQGTRMEDPKPTFAYFVSQVKERFPSLAYLHVVEPRVAGNRDRSDTDSNEFLRKIWGKKVFITAGEHTPQTAAETVNAKGGLIAFGRHCVANPRSYSLRGTNGI
ncbi:NADH:flavin oxidoreductase/NADH oxidase [Thelephora ganbajun]|uniref:NADH:flavin oxidoreductase/NADH oxidase n=1 Tax=Thelephora ganbajun TaxID=370292 RepID=A0ACB6ZLR3_THEGA|nr:NADH:flavin oxidoreductase/NADH oxidase [Thelephora ganbajun]